ncbi:hypothetical protein C0J52_24933 [Blattella germanica]|nr:hypothetical protein C0J52_24933 [Blattella germanica]
MVNMIQNGLAHGTSCNVMMNSKRAEVVDFIAPLLEERTYVFIKEPDSIPMKWTDFIRPFSVELRCLVVGIYIILSFVLWFTQVVDKWRKRDYRINDAMFAVFATFCTQSQDLEKIRGPCRIVFFTSHLTALVLMAGYSASLISTLASREISLPFHDFQGLLEDGSYKVGVLTNSAQFDNIKLMSELAIRKVYWKLMAPYVDSMPLNDEEAFQRVCSEKFAYLSEFLETVGTKQPCRVTPVPQASIPATLSMAIAKNSPYLRLFNHLIQRMRRAGILKKLKLQILDTHIPETSNPTRRLDLVQVAPLFSILLLGFVASINILFLERLMYRKRSFVSSRKNVYQKDVETLDEQ